MADFTLQQKQVQHLSAQQILGSQLLQLPMQQLEERIYQEVQENPMLELVEAPRDGQIDGVVAEPSNGAVGEMFDSIDRFSRASLNSRVHSGSPSSGQGGSDDSKERFFQAVQHDSLAELLCRQLALQEHIGEREMAIAEEILGNLDSDGYFTESIELIVASLQQAEVIVSNAEVEAVLHSIHFLDPAGIAVRNVQQRLMVQLQVAAHRYPAATYNVAMRLLGDYYDDFLNRRLDMLLKKLGVPKAELEAAVTAIIALDLHPGVFYDEGGHYISPDVIVTYENGELTAALNDRSALSVKVTDRYRELLANRKAPKEEKQFIRHNIQRAQDFATALAMRRQTLLKVMEALLKQQYAFFVSGPEHVVPLGMKSVAEETGLDISTISRAVNGKYVQTRFGVFELRYFFGSALSTDEGEELSSKIIRQHLAEIIKAEDSAHPLSDDTLAEMLVSKGIRIARRTVAKYREQMQIPVARLRKKIF
uniref:RNA polymerase, sigma 54 subunit, RpoN/SigL n=1 Tax=Chlorobium chlorochromatii (strain CaD3) TaxID=340177 RepID=Q3ASH8_CHLCH